MKAFKSFILMVVTMVIVSGCISTGSKLNPANVASIKKRVTTEADIRAMFGEPVTLTTNTKRGIKTLTYGYKNDDSVKKGAAGVAGAIAGGVLGAQIGGGTGSVIASGVGSLVGGFFASNAVTARKERQYLEVKISMRTGKVVDYNYIESKGRSQKIGFNSGVSAL